MNRILVVLIALGLIAASGAGLAWHQYTTAPLGLPDSPMRLRVERGASLTSVGASLREQGVDLPAWKLALAARLRGDAHTIKAGVYELVAPITLAGLLHKLVRGDVMLFDVTVVEGWTFRQMRAALARHPELRQDSAQASDAAILEKLGAPEDHPEGLFFPSTYRFSPGSSDYDIYAQAYRMMKKELDQAWASREPGVPLASPYQALVLASIVEKETGRPEDRAMVAGVFANRLRIGMMLQSDPTTIYGLGERFDGDLRRKDLSMPTPYNTYTRAGLPPTPIALPGRDALRAALRPAETRALYFVSRGDGSSEFSENLAAHNRAVERFQLRRRER